HHTTGRFRKGTKGNVRHIHEEMPFGIGVLLEDWNAVRRRSFFDHPKASANNNQPKQSVHWSCARIKQALSQGLYFRKFCNDNQYVIQSTKTERTLTW